MGTNFVRIKFINKMSNICVKGNLFSLDNISVMGILNVNRDSFYDGGRYNDSGAYLKQTEKMLKEGADIIDIGFVSTHPGACEVPEENELQICTKTIPDLISHFPEAIFSIDTWRSKVARLSYNLGISIINDISGGDFDDNMFDTIAELQIPYILMHTSEKPDKMQSNTSYDNVVNSVFLYLSKRLDKLRRLNVKDIIIDPGFGFGKTIEQNYELLKHLSNFKALHCPILAGLSRKSMLYKKTGGTPSNALYATIAANTIALTQGAKILRVHDVKAAKDAICIWKSCN